MKGSVMEEVRRIFKPEFLNRIDETIVFRSLNKDDMKQIVTSDVERSDRRVVRAQHGYHAVMCVTAVKTVHCGKGIRTEIWSKTTPPQNPE